MHRHIHTNACVHVNIYPPAHARSSALPHSQRVAGTRAQPRNLRCGARIHSRVYVHTLPLRFNRRGAIGAHWFFLKPLLAPTGTLLVLERTGVRATTIVYRPAHPVPQVMMPEKKHLSPEEALGVLRTLASVLAYLHEGSPHRAPIACRRITPETIHVRVDMHVGQGGNWGGRG
eukprot:GHVU01078887.1.p2 GENE.GHVU01078887.1~~GHVU01078887.1.p2  ORF type:complete len:174 (+),score=8.46 GHVU01078887.1:652-1173(+)